MTVESKSPITINPPFRDQLADLPARTVYGRSRGQSSRKNEENYHTHFRRTEEIPRSAGKLRGKGKEEDMGNCLEEIKAMTGDVITPAVAAGALGCDPHWIRLVAREDPKRLGFPVIVLRSRVKIPRLAFIKFMEGVSA